MLSAEGRAAAARLSAKNTLCAFDYDGTLAPIVRDPARAHMRARTRGLLTRLAAVCPCVVISGRARSDLAARLRGVGLRRVIGNHGAETEGAPRARRQALKRWKAALEPVVASVAGAWIEDKAYSLAVHYRQAERKSEARGTILAAIGTLDRVQVIGGKQVINLLPPGARTKGAALAQERDRLACESVLYVGDDENDEEAFALDGNVMAVRVGRKRGSRASYYLRNQVEIDALLEILLAIREPE